MAGTTYLLQAILVLWQIFEFKDLFFYARPIHHRRNAEAAIGLRARDVVGRGGLRVHGGCL